MNGRLLYRVPEVAESLGLSRAKVNQLIASGSLPTVKIDGSRRVHVDDLRAFVEQRKVAAAAKEARSDVA